MSDEASMVQDKVTVESLQEGASTVPVKLHTLLVRKPGRVQAAEDFIDRCLSSVGFGACGTGDEVKHDLDDKKNYVSGAPSKEFLETRSAALRCLTAYFNGMVDDELVVQAQFKINRQPFDVRFIGKIDAETGVVRDARYAPSPTDAKPGCAVDTLTRAEQMKDAVPPEVIALSDGGTCIVPDGVRYSDIEAICATDDPRFNPKILKFTMKSGHVVFANRDTGAVVALPLPQIPPKG